MNKHLLIFTLLYLFVGCSKDPINYNNLQNRSGLKFKINDSKPYTGSTIQTFQNGQKALEGYFKEGLENGKWIEWHNNGQKESEGIYLDGKKDGEWIWWNSDGDTLKKGAYENGLMEGKWFFSFINKDNNEKQSLTGYFSSGDGSDLHENSGVPINGRNGLFINKDKSEKILTEVRSKNGQMNGPFTTCHDNGQIRAQGSYKDGLLHGEFKNWDENGNIVFNGAFKDGEETFEKLNKEELNKLAIISTKFGDMVVEFYYDVAPMHVENFQILADEGYFDGTTFHRVIPGFVIQGGDPNSKDEDRMNDGTGGRAGKFFGIGREEDPSSWTIPAEFNDKDHVKGTLSMARSSNPNSGSSQFFICHAATPQLNTQYTVFGQVIEGLDVIDQIVYSERDKRDNPIDKVEMTVRIKHNN